MISSRVSIVIPTYNRCDDLERSLDVCSRLRPSPEEVIVIDDASTDKTRDFMEKNNSPWVRYIRMPENRGELCARNIGMAKARGEIVVSLDDDTYFLDPDALAQIIRRFEMQPDCGILTSRVFTPREDIFNPEDRIYWVSSHLEGASAFRKSLLKQIGYYLPFMETCGGEADVSLKALDVGYAIILDHNIRIFHEFDPSKRDRKWHENTRKKGMRNDLLEVLVRFPAPWVIPAIGAKIVSHFRFAFRRQLVVPSLMALCEFFTMAPVALRHRKPVSTKTIRRYLALRGKAEEVISLSG